MTDGLMTGAEARKCWCPFARVPLIKTSRERPVVMTAINRTEPDSGVAAPCIASDCMAWRWADGRAQSGKGYCGLAGKVLV
jgi:hypothetical protein